VPGTGVAATGGAGATGAEAGCAAAEAVVAAAEAAAVAADAGAMLAAPWKLLPSGCNLAAPCTLSKAMPRSEGTSKHEQALIVLQSRGVPGVDRRA
jgi:hypothetical protein